MAKVNIKPKIGEITTETNFLDSIGSLPNPDLILRNAGIAEDTYIEMMYDAQIFTAYQKRKRKIQRYNYELSGGNDDDSNPYGTSLNSRAYIGFDN